MTEHNKSNKSKRWFMYVVKCNDDTLYTGITTDVERRIQEHNESKKGAKYTASRRPVSIVYARIFDNQSQAAKAESKFRRLPRTKKLNIIDGKMEFKL